MERSNNSHTHTHFAKQRLGLRHANCGVVERLMHGGRYQRCSLPPLHLVYMVVEPEAQGETILNRFQSSRNKWESVTVPFHFNLWNIDLGLLKPHQRWYSPKCIARRLCNVRFPIPHEANGILAQRASLSRAVYEKLWGTVTKCTYPPESTAEPPFSTLQSHI